MLRVKEICAQQGITLADLAQKMGVQPPSISSAINGNPTLSTLEGIAEALGVRITDLFERDDFHALIDHKGKLYRARSIGELKNIISEIESVSNFPSEVSGR